MRSAFIRCYGSHPIHLLTMICGFALLGYVVAVMKPDALYNPRSWWQSIIVWFVAAVVGHDLLLFPSTPAWTGCCGTEPGDRSRPVCQCSITFGCPRWAPA